MKRLLLITLSILATGAMRVPRVSVREHKIVREVKPLKESPLDDGPTFEFDPGLRGSALSNLDSTLCINGTCDPAHLVYVGTDATVASWPARVDEDGDGTLTNDAGGTDPTVGSATPLLDTNTAVEFNAGDGYAAAGIGTGTIDTEDFAFEMVVQGTTATQTLWSRYSGAGGSSWGFYQNGTTVWRLSLQNGASLLTFDCTHTIVDRAWYHLMVFVNRDENSVSGVNWYVNGVSCGTGNASTLSAALHTTTYLMTIGDQPAGSGNSPFSRRFAWGAMWKSASWFATGATGPSQWAAVALDRFSRLTGILPTVARGSTAPIVMTRASVGTLSKCTSNVTSMFLVGANWPRVGRRCDGRSGYRSEPQITNTFLQSRDLGTSWTKIDVGDAITGSVTTPFGLTSTTAGIAGDSTAGSHGLTQSATVTATTWTMSAIVKAGSRNYAYLSDDTVANATGFFTITSGACATGTKGAGARELFAENLGNGWCRISMSFTGTAAAHTFAINVADDAVSDLTISGGDGTTVMIYATEMQLEPWPHPTAAIPTTTATATRSVDALAYSSTSNASVTAGSLVCSIYTPSNDSAFMWGPQINGGTIDQDAIAFHFDANEKVNFDAYNAAAAQAAIVGTSDVTNGAVRTLSASWQSNQFQLFVDGVQEGATDTSGLVPASFTTIRIGTLGGPGGDIDRCRVFQKAGVRQ